MTQKVFHYHHRAEEESSGRFRRRDRRATAGSSRRRGRALLGAHRGGRAARDPDGPGREEIARRGASDPGRHVVGEQRRRCARGQGRGAAHQALAAEGKLATTILWPYADKLQVFRLVAPIMGGKPGQGWQGRDAGFGAGSGGPARPAATLFRDGPGNALFTLMSIDTRGKARWRRKRAPSGGAGLSRRQKAGRSGGAGSRATAQTLSKNGRPVRQIHMSKVDEFEMVALMMHFMLETILMGRLMGVDPFNQPG